MSHISEIRGVASGQILFDEADLPLLKPFSWSIGSHGYAQGCAPGIKIVVMHQLLMGETPRGMLIDHINRNKLDNRRENLRFVTPSESNMNRRTTGGGIYRTRTGSWTVRIQRQRVNHYVGTAKTYEEAEVMRNKWLAERGEF